MAELTAAELLDGLRTWAERVYRAAGLKVEVALHGGRFTPADLERYAARATACRIALEGLRFALNGRGQLVASGHAVAVVLAGDQGRAGSRALNVLAATVPLQAALPGSRCDMALVDSIDAKDVRAANLYSAALDKQGTAGWVVTWPVEFIHPRTP